MLFQGNDGVIGDMDLFQADLRAALGDITQAESANNPGTLEAAVSASTRTPPIMSDLQA